MIKSINDRNLRKNIREMCIMFILVSELIRIEMKN